MSNLPLFTSWSACSMSISWTSYSASVRSSRSSIFINSDLCSSRNLSNSGKSKPQIKIDLYNNAVQRAKSALLLEAHPVILNTCSSCPSNTIKITWHLARKGTCKRNNLLQLCILKDYKCMHCLPIWKLLIMHWFNWCSKYYPVVFNCSLELSDYTWYVNCLVYSKI